VNLAAADLPCRFHRFHRSRYFGIFFSSVSLTTGAMQSLREPKRRQPTIHPMDRRPYAYPRFGFGLHPVRTIQAQNLHSLPTVEVLQQDFATVGKAHSVAVSDSSDTKRARCILDIDP
jgi:hypothetical protein